MLAAFSNDWIRTRNLRSTWVFIGIVFIFSLVISFSFRNPTAQVNLWTFTLQWFEFLSWVLVIMAAWRYGIVANSGVLAMNAITQRCRWYTFVAVTINSVIISLVMLVSAVAIQFLFLQISGASVSYSHVNALGAFMVALVARVLFFSALTAIVNSTLGGVLITAMWVGIEGAIGFFAFIVSKNSMSTLRTVNECLFNTNLSAFTTAVNASQSFEPVNLLVPLVWIVVALAGAFFAISRRDIH